MMTLTTLSLLFLAATPVEPDGKALFASKKCTLCHSVTSEGIKAPDGTKMQIVDLSAQPKRKADWVKAYLEKKETVEGKPHPARFKGTPEELDALSKWLATLKPGA